MATPGTKHLLRTALGLAAPGVLVLALLVGIGALALGTALVAALALLCLMAAWSLRPLDRLRKLQLRIEKMDAAGSEPDAGQEGATLGDPGTGAIGDLTTSLQRLERNWSRDRKALTDGLAAAATLFDALPDPLITLDRQSRLVYANAAARALLAEGRPEEDLQGRDLSAVLRQPVVLDAVNEVLAGAAASAVEFTFTDRVDQTFEARIAAIADGEIDENDARVLLLLHDVTARRRGEQSRADFVANVSHELRTPLTSLIGFIETLRGPAREDRAASERFLALMATQSGRMARLVNDLLSLSQIELNEHTPPDEAVDLRTTIGTVVDLLAPQTRERNVSIQTSLDAIAGPITGDHDELIQLFQNLIENAIKYTHEGTTVRVETTADADTVTVSVIDQGEGIAAEHLSRLTERFYRIDTARSRELGGTGLGLAIVKHIVNRHRGDLTIDSSEGEGSTFSVTLPLAEVSEETAGTTQVASTG